MLKSTVITIRIKRLALLMAILTSLLSNSSTYGTDVTKPFPFTEVIKKMDWPGPGGSKIEGMLVCSYPEFVTVLAGEVQHKIPRRSLKANHLLIVKMLDEELDYLKTSILPDYVTSNSYLAKISNLDCTTLSLFSFYFS